MPELAIKATTQTALACAKKVARRSRIMASARSADLGRRLMEIAAMRNGTLSDTEVAERLLPLRIIPIGR